MGSATTGNANSASTMNTRIIFTAAAMPADQARAIVELICASSPERAAEQRRNRIERHFYNALLRILKFAKHETLRKLQRYLYSHRPLTGQDEQADHPDSVRIGFNVDELQRDLNAMLETEGVSALNSAANDTLEQVGFRDPWKLPAQDTLDFIARRQNLLSNVPQEIFDTIRDQISAGLNKGESIRDLSRRISTAFDEIGKERAQVIAQTETAAAYGFASDKAARAAGIQYKKWIHSVQSKVPRPDHLAIDGLIIPMDEAYPVGDPPLMYPHAPDGSAEDVINCRCMSIPVSEADYQAQKIKSGEAEGHPFRGNQYTVGVTGNPEATTESYHDSLDQDLNKKYGWNVTEGSGPGNKTITDQNGRNIATITSAVKNGKLILSHIEALPDETGRRFKGLGLVDKIFQHAAKFSKENGLEIYTSARTNPITRSKFEKYFPAGSGDVIGNVPGAAVQTRGGGTSGQGQSRQ